MIVSREYIASYSAVSNGRAEQLNRILVDKSLAMIHLIRSRCKKLWAEAVSAAFYTRNRIFSKGCQVEGSMPIEALTGTKPDVSNFEKFGCNLFVNIHSLLRGNQFANQAMKGIMVGYI